MEKNIYLKNGDRTQYDALPNFDKPQESEFEGKRYTVIKKVKEYPLVKRIGWLFFYTILTILSLGMALKSEFIRNRFSKACSGKKIIALWVEQEKGITIPILGKDATGTERILQSGNFKGEARGRRIIQGYNVREAQGSDELRKNARLLTLDNPDLLNPENLKKAKGANRINYLMIKLKRLGHAFSMERDVKGENKFGYEGFSEDFTIPMLASSLNKAEEKLGGDGKFRFTGAVLNRSLSQEWMPQEKIQESLKVIHNPTSDEIVSISSGYDWHGTHVLFFKGHLIYCNKGNYGKGGINIYRIPNPKEISEKNLRDLCERQKFENHDFPSEDKLIDALNLQHVLKVNLKGQAVGNCTYVSTRAGARAIMAIFALLKDFKGSDAASLSYGVWSRAFNEIRNDYKRFFQFDREMLLDDLRDDVQTHQDNYSSIISKETLFGDLLRKIRYKCKPEHLNMLQGN